MSEIDAQRIDKWLWYARFFKTRSLATKFVNASKIRVKSNGQSGRITKPSQTVKPDDVLTFAMGRQIRVIKVRAPGTRRGPALEAQSLYEDLSPPNVEQAKAISLSPGQRDEGSGRPTKRQRRALDRWRSTSE
ncbi:MAG: RNA-binding S4 domain-containing protein [Alphaproteobacteria bacterium]|nr:MAG: RNA-binding S4 domain-containing protein [Alphaproteobacteria bacterium]